jgi:formylglycine-generating enzyme required for sulfatase activity
MPHRLLGLLSSILFVLIGAFSAEAQNKRALVIGIDAYGQLPKLERAVADARAMARVLAELGFAVRLVENPDRVAMSGAFGQFRESLQAGDTAFVFFAGHGLEIEGQNILLPRDAPSPAQTTVDQVRDAGFFTAALIDRVTRQGARAAFFVFDACRSNPYAARKQGRAIGASKGLARQEAPEGVFVLMSAGQGQEALDNLNLRGRPITDTDANSVFTRVLIAELRRPGLTHIELAKAVQLRVRDLAQGIGHTQLPAFYDQIVGNVVFRAAAPAPRLQPVPVPPAARADELAWNLVKDSLDRATLERFIAQFPTSPRRAEAEARLALLRQLASAAPAPATAASLPVPLSTLPSLPPPGTPVTRLPLPLTAAELAALKVREPFRECEGCPEMIVVPAGTFMMGTPKDEVGRYELYDPAPRKVSIPQPFAVGRFEVTFEEWEACLREGGCRNYRPNDSGFGRGRQPVINVSYHDAQAYVAWLSQKTGKTYRLLTGEEWEYAARAGTTTPFSFGPTISGEDANYRADTAYANGPVGVFRKRPVPVGSFKPNAFGLYDMHGNVSEWVADCVEPPDETCGARLMRGGDFTSYPRDVRAGRRNHEFPGIRFATHGFRVARNLTH